MRNRWSVGRSVGFLFCVVEWGLENVPPSETPCFGMDCQSNPFPSNSEAKFFLQSVIKVEPISSLFCSVTLLTSSILIRKTSGAVVQVKLIGYDHNQCFGLDCRIGLDWNALQNAWFDCGIDWKLSGPDWKKNLDLILDFNELCLCLDIS